MPESVAIKPPEVVGRLVLVPPTSRATLAHAAQQLDEIAALLRAIARELVDDSPTCRP